MNDSFHIRKATELDVDQIVHLLNKAYRGESSQKGWTTEAHLIAGEIRTDEETVIQLIQKPESLFTLYIDAENTIAGCVNLQKLEHKLYLGMLAVSPEKQGAGIGKILLKKAEEQANIFKCTSIYMTVISVRTELIDWYKRHGYADTGQRNPFPENALTGKHLTELEFMVLEKNLNRLP